MLALHAKYLDVYGHMTGCIKKAMHCGKKKPRRQYGGKEKWRLFARDTAKNLKRS